MLESKPDEKEGKEEFFKVVERQYKSDKEFAKVLDDLALESLFLKLKLVPEESRKALDLEVLGRMELADLSRPAAKLDFEKARAIERLRQCLENPDATKSLKLKIASLQEGGLGEEGLAYRPPELQAVGEYFSRYSDLWNRSGVIALEFRKNILEAKTGKKFKSLEDFGRDAIGRRNDDKFIEYLFSNKEFVEAYNSIEWNGTEMRSVFKNQYQTAAGKAVPEPFSKQGLMEEK